MGPGGMDQGGETPPRPCDDQELGRLFPGESELSRRRAEALAESEARLAVELAVMERLQELSTRLVNHDDAAGLLPEIVDVAIGITGAEMGNVQLYDKASDTLRIVASRGFRDEDLELLAVIRRGESTCGTALERGERVVVGDVTASAIFAGKPILGKILAADIRALQSTPLISRSGRLVGMLSTHYRARNSPAERDLRILDLLARQATDWIERTQAEAALRESESRFRNLADHAPVMIWVTDPTGACHYVNERWCNFTGTSRQKNYEFGWLDSVHADDRKKSGSVFRSAAANKEAFRAEYRLRRHDGEYRWVIDSAAPRFAHDGAYLGHIGSVLDVTNEKRAEEEIRRARDQLEVRVAQRTAELEAEFARRTDLARRLATAQEDERRRLSRDLHDSVGQLLAALPIAFGAVEFAGGLTASAAARLAEARHLVDAVSREVHALAVRLRPTALDDLGLEAALEQLVAEWSSRSGVAADFQSSGLGPGRLPLEVETAVYRLVQESLTNVAKHARARIVSVVVSRPDGYVTAVIEDDGAGFVPGAVPKGRLGLGGMRERVALLGGEFDIESSPGEGTAVRIRIPVHKGGGE